MQTATEFDLVPRPKTVFFDWDGTLADSFEFIYNAHVYAQQQLGVKILSMDEFRSYFGRAREVVYKGLYGEENMDAAAVHFTSYVKDNHIKDLKPMNGAEDILKILSDLNIPVGVLSNKMGDIIRLEAEHFGWKKYLCKVWGNGDISAGKPAAAPLIEVLNASGFANIPMSDVWYVGDTIVDQGCSMNAGCKFVFIGDDAQLNASPYEYEPLLKFRNCEEMNHYLLQYA